MERIAIINDEGLTLQLTPGQVLVTEQAVAWTADDELPAEYSYPLRFPLNDANKRFLKLGYRPDGARPSMQLPVTVQLEGVLYRKCTLSYRVIDRKGDGYLKIDASQVYDKLRNLTLLDALPDQISLGDGIKIRNGVSTNVSLSTRMRQIADMEPGLFPCTFFPIRNELFIEEGYQVRTDLPAFRPVNVNNYVDGRFTADTQTDKGNFIVPQFYLTWVLERIMALAGYRIEGNWLGQKEVQRLTVLNMTAMDTRTGLLATFGHTLTAGLHLPEMSVSDFLKAIKGRYGLGIAFNANTKVCYINQLARTIESGEVQDLTAYQSGDYSVDPAVNKGFTLLDYVDENDELNKDAKGNLIRPAAIVVGAGEQEIPLRAGTVPVTFTTSGLNFSAKWFIPTVRMAGNILDPTYSNSERYLDAEGKRKNNCGLRLLSYRGFTIDTKGNAYPLGTSDVRNGRQELIGQQGQTLTGRNGLYRHVLRPYFYLRDQTQAITQTLLMPVPVLAQLKLHELVALTLEDNIKRNYLINRLSAESPGPSGKAFVRLQVLTIPLGLELGADEDPRRPWVELIQEDTPGRFYQESPPGLDPRIVSEERSKLTVRLWANAQKTVSFTPQGLTLLIRRKHKPFSLELSPDDPNYYEVIDRYTLTQAVTVIEPSILRGFIMYTTKRYMVNYNQVFELEPSDDYNLILS